MPKRSFSFISNSLSKSGYLRGFIEAMLFSGKKNLQKCRTLVSTYFEVPEERIFFFGAGRMSVYALLKSLQLKSTDEVIVAGYTCVVLTNAVKFAGARIQYVDINPESLNLDTELLIKAINVNTRAIIIPHNFGLVYEDVAAIKSQFPNLIIIEDVAHSFGSKYANGQFCGTLGDAGFFSLEYSKPLTAGLGGIMVLNNPQLLEGMQKEYKTIGVMSRGMSLKILFTLGTLNLWHFKSTSFFQRIGMKVLRMTGLNYKTSDQEIAGQLPPQYPVKMNPVLANVLVQQLRKVKSINDEKKAIVKRYQKAFGEFNDFIHYATDDQILVRYPILFKSGVSTETIEQIKLRAKAKGIVFGDWFNDVVHPKGSYRYCYNSGDCPQGEMISARMLNLPVNVYQQLSEETLNEISNIFREVGIN